MFQTLRFPFALTVIFTLHCCLSQVAMEYPPKAAEDKLVTTVSIAKPILGSIGLAVLKLENFVKVYALCMLYMVTWRIGLSEKNLSVIQHFLFGRNELEFAIPYSRPDSVIPVVLMGEKTVANERERDMGNRN